MPAFYREADEVPVAGTTSAGTKTRYTALRDLIRLAATEPTPNDIYELKHADNPMDCNYSFML